MKTDHDSKAAILRFVKSMRRDLPLPDGYPTADDIFDDMTMFLVDGLAAVPAQDRDALISMMEDIAASSECLEKYGTAKLS